MKRYVQPKIETISFKSDIIMIETSNIPITPDPVNPRETPTSASDNKWEEV